MPGGSPSTHWPKRCAPPCGRRVGAECRPASRGTAIAAEVAATVVTPVVMRSDSEGGAGTIVVVPPGEDRAFLAPYPLRVLRADAIPIPQCSRC